MSSQILYDLSIIAQTHVGPLEYPLPMHCGLEGGIFNDTSASNEVGLLTIHDCPHILRESVDNLKGLRCGSMRFVLS